MGEKCCGKMAEGCCGTMGAEHRYNTAYFVIDNSGSASKQAGGHFDQFQGAALKAIDRTRGIEQFIIVPMNGQTHQVAGDKATAKEIVKNMRVGGGTMSLKTLIPKGLDYEYDTYVFTDAPQGGIFHADTATVEEPDWIPDGDGRAIGQQDFAINLSPLHAESKFDKVSDKIADEYEDDGVSPEEAERIGDATAAKIGYAKLGKREMMRRAKAGRRKNADMVGSPSPTFDEGITGQDGPSADPTNATFEARARYGPQEADMKRARDTLIRRGYAKDNGDILQDEFLYNDEPSKRTGRKADKYHYFAVIENNGRYYAINIYGPSRGNQTVINILGATGDKANSMVSTGSVSTALSAWNDKKKAKARKGYRPILFGQKGSIDIYGAEETLAEIEGPTAEATSGGLHSPSSFTMSWEDGAGYSSASIPPNEIAWAETSGIPTWVKAGAGLVLLLAGGSFLKSKMSEQKAADNLKSAINSRKGCGCGSRKTFNAYNRMGIAESQDEQTCRANGGMWIHGDRNTPSHCEYGEDTLPKGGGLQNALDGGVTFQSEYSVGQINPVEVEGQNDIYGAEDYRLSTPQVSQPNWGPQTTYRQNPRRNLKMW